MLQFSEFNQVPVTDYKTPFITSVYPPITGYKRTSKDGTVFVNIHTFIKPSYYSLSG